jgi:hypothetical protein
MKRTDFPFVDVKTVFIRLLIRSSDQRPLISSRPSWERMPDERRRIWMILAGFFYRKYKGVRRIGATSSDPFVKEYDPGARSLPANRRQLRRPTGGRMPVSQARLEGGLEIIGAGFTG